MRTIPVVLIASWLLAAPLQADTYTVNTDGSENDGCPEAPDPQICDTGACGSPTGDCTLPRGWARILRRHSGSTFLREEAPLS